MSSGLSMVPTVADLGVAGFFALLLWAAVSDLRTMEIPNRISVGLVAGFLLVAPFAGFDLAAVGWHLLVGLLWLAIGYGLMVAGIMGGGDVKVASAAVVWMGPGHQIDFLYATGLAGGLLAVAFLLARLPPQPAFAARRPWMRRLLSKDEGIPYAVAIAAGAAFAFPATFGG